MMMTTNHTPRVFLPNLDIAKLQKQQAISNAKRQATRRKNRHNKTFPCKLHRMLRDAAADGNEHIVSWVANGKAFKVHSVDGFVEHIMPRYFRQTKFRSFTRQLQLYGFIRECKATFRGSYRHPSFLRDQEELHERVVRQKSQTNSKAEAATEQPSTQSKTIATATATATTKPYLALPIAQAEREDLCRGNASVGSRNCYRRDESSCDTSRRSSFTSHSSRDSSVATDMTASTAAGTTSADVVASLHTSMNADTATNATNGESPEQLSFLGKRFFPTDNGDAMTTSSTVPADIVVSSSRVGDEGYTSDVQQWQEV